MSDQPAAIEDTYELSPMQQGMLYDTIASSTAGMYSIVVSYRIQGALDAAALFDAWRMVIARHPILRTSFHRHEQREPTQVVHRHVILPVAEHDWRGLEAAAQQARLTALLEAENGRGFDVTVAPLVRLALVRCADDTHELVVAHHHLLLDGSCKPLLFAEVFAAYDAIRFTKNAEDAKRSVGLALEEPQPYRRFIEWLREQDRQEAERFWRDEVSSMQEPTPLWPAATLAKDDEHDYREHHFALDTESVDALKRFARAHRLTLNTVVSGAWALLLGHVSRRDDVLFGATVNARPPTLDGAEAMLGLFINTLPVRFTIARGSTVVDWLRQAQIRQMRAREHDYAPLSSMHAWSGLPRTAPLFESIIVFENNAGFGSDSERHGSLEITNVQAHIRNSLPLTLRCVPGRTLSMQLLYETSRFSAETIRTIAGQLVRVLGELPAGANAPVERLLDLLDEDERVRAEAAADAFQRAVREKLSIRRRRASGSSTREP